MTELSYILLGSNIDPHQNMKKAIALLYENFHVVTVSAIFESRPVKKKNVENYLNAIAAINTELDPVTIKYDYLRKIENELGRTRSRDKFKPRKIDLDLIIWKNEIYKNPDADLILPDPEIVEYAHIALPMADIAPDLVHPVVNQTMSQIADKFKSDPSVNRIDFPLN